MKPVNFTTQIRALKEDEYEKYHVSKASMLEIATANSLLPESFTQYKNMDILPVLFSIAVVNKFNNNDDAISPLEAAKLLSSFPHKPINIEHKKELIVGHLIKASFSNQEPAFSEDDPLDYLDRTDPFFISGAGFIYRSIFPKLAEALVSASDENDESYNAYAASWEIGFNAFDIAVGDGDTIGETRIVTASDPDFEKLSSQLKANKGSGKTPDGQSVRRILRGEKTPLGVGLTENPAAKVEGIYALASINDEKISEKIETHVTNNEIDTAMDEKQFQELKTLLTALASREDVTDPAQEAFNKIEGLLAEKGKDWKASADKTEEALKETQATLKDVETKLSEAEQKISSFEEDIAVRDSADKLNDRMATIASEFSLEDAEEKIVAKEVAALSSDDSDFEKYLEKAKVVFAHRNTKVIEQARLDKEAADKEAAKNKEKPEEVSSIAAQLQTLETKASTPFLNNVGEDADGKGLLERLQMSGLVLED